ncbi:hypothetical protein AYO38_02855 [bacterium SCGC AG-212-C10]|nr:hypothetical protein AYO38_02855 [bacterium SCGC AG-212-C10]
MVNPLGDASIGGIRDWLNGLASRQSAISDNIANIDTPGYSRKEVPFEAALRQAQTSGSHLATTNARHIPLAPGSSRSMGVNSAQELMSSRRDGNNVDIDAEMISLAETQMRYQAATSALNTKLSTLRNVIRGG